MFRIYGAIAAFVVLGSLFFGCKYYYDTTQEKISALVENNATLEVANEANTQTIVTLVENETKQRQLNQQLNISLQSAESYKEDLLQTLQKHDLTRLSISKPGLIEQRINEATKKLFDDIESDTAVEQLLPIQ